MVLRFYILLCYLSIFTLRKISHDQYARFTFEVK